MIKDAQGRLPVWTALNYRPAGQNVGAAARADNVVKIQFPSQTGRCTWRMGNHDHTSGFPTNGLAGLLLGLLCIAGGCGTSGVGVVNSTQGFPPGTGFTPHRFVVDGNVETVWIFLPKGYRPDKKYPAILFLHGLFERGKGGEDCLSGGLGPVIAKNPDNWPFITVFPQSDGTWQGKERERLAMASLDFAVKRWSIDEDRVTLAGLSYGGLGVWEIGARNPERFCSLVPISGHKASEVIDRLILLPIWAFGFSTDPFVPVKCSEEMCEEINGKGGKMKLTEFVGIGHDAWPQAVNDSDLVNWMLKQRRPADIAERARNISVADVQR